MRRVWIVLAALPVVMSPVLLAAGCGRDRGTPVASADRAPGAAAPASPGSSAPPSAGAAAPTDPKEAGVAFARCVRERGVEIVDPPDPEDPRSAIRFELDVNGKGDDMAFQAALDACLPLLPPPPPDVTTPEDLAADEALHAYSACVRANGAPDFPDLGNRPPGAGRVFRNEPLPSIPPQAVRNCAAELARVDAAQDAAQRAGQQRK